MCPLGQAQECVEQSHFDAHRARCLAYLRPHQAGLSPSTVDQFYFLYFGFEAFELKITKKEDKIMKMTLISL